MDDADLSQARLEAEMENLMAGRRWSMLPVKGTCYNCDEPTEERWCSAECRDDWEQRREAYKRNGRG